MRMMPARVLVNASPIAGMGGFANKNIQAGEIVMMFTGRRVTSDEADDMLDKGELRADDPLQVREDEYIILDDVSIRLNHSCDPNTGMRGENELVALRDIAKGEELTYDYSTVVGANNHGWKMKCTCRSESCRRSVGSVLTLPKERIRFYSLKKVLPDFILKQLSGKR